MRKPRKAARARRSSSKQLSMFPSPLTWGKGHMIYSIGYSGRTPEDIAKVMAALKVDVLIDTRGKPVSRKPGFSRKQLEARFGSRYAWHGDHLGGPGSGGTITAGGINTLRKLHREGKTLLLMCLEKSPGQCHRHDIAMRLYKGKPAIDVMHVYQDQMFYASAIQADWDNDTWVMQRFPLEV
jgi:uncharacterized protein (DUF488 family)